MQQIEVFLVEQHREPVGQRLGVRRENALEIGAAESRADQPVCHPAVHLARAPRERRSAQGRSSGVVRQSHFRSVSPAR